MDLNLIMIPVSILEKKAVMEIIDCNDITIEYGLTLSRIDALEIVKTRTEALTNNGRVEFGGGIIDKLILNFCDSPYISQRNYTETLHQLLEIFYYFKNETLDLLADDELLVWMKWYFDGSCQGCIDLLKHRELEKLAHDVRYGTFNFTDPRNVNDSIYEVEQDEI